MLHNHTVFAPPASRRRHDRLAQHSATVRKIAWSVYARVSSAIELDDLVQIGFVALLECADHYEDRGFAFATYAATRVRGAMIDQLRKAAPLSRTAMARRRAMARTRSDLEAQLSRPPTAFEMAAAMGVPPAEYHRQLQSLTPVEGDSVDAVYSDHDGRFADAADAADVQLESAQIGRLLDTEIAALSERDAAILKLFFVEDWNLEQIGQTLGVGAARVCQIKKSALQKLRRQLEPVL